VRDWHVTQLENPINIAVPLLAIFAFVRLIVQFDGNDRREPRIADNEVDMSWTDPTKIWQPEVMAFIRFDQICDSNFRDNGMWSNGFPKNLVKRSLRLCEQVFPSKERLKRNVHASDLAGNMPSTQRLNCSTTQRSWNLECLSTTPGSVL
jgi:hypothetical protein